MKFISFKKFKAYLESQGYVQEQGKNIYGAPIFLEETFYSKEGEVDKYSVKTYMFSDKVASIWFGHGSFYSGNITRVKVDYRKKFWKELLID